MRIGVYSICKNESRNLERFMACASEADQIVVVDTGSTDGTWDMLRQLSNVRAERLEINPWRFDVARNHALSLLPKDFQLGVWLDIDETFAPGWREKIERVYDVEVTRYSNHFVNTVTGFAYRHFKIHSLKGCHWINPIHEQLVFDRPDKEIFVEGLICYHDQDLSKPRSFYIEMLESYLRSGDLKAEEYYPLLIREYFVNNRWQDVVDLFERLQSENVLYRFTRARQTNSWRYYLASRIELKLKTPSEWVEKYVATYPTLDHRYVGAWMLFKLGDYQAADKMISLCDQREGIDYGAEFIHPYARAERFNVLRDKIKEQV